MRKNAAALALVFVFLAASCITTDKPVSGAAIVENSWVTKTPLQKAIGSIQVAAANGKIYAISGSANEEYDPATDTWTPKRPMPTSRNYFAVATHQNKIYVIGGQSGYIPAGDLRILTAVNEVYDPATDTWETKTPLPTPRFYLSASTVNDKIFLIGGLNNTDYNPPLSILDLNEAYDPQADTWSAKTPTPNPVYAYASAVLDGKIYLFGGGASESDLAQIYDAAADSWSYGQRMPDKTRSMAAAATTGGKAPKRIYVVGGMIGFGNPLDSNRVYNPETDNWTVGASMITARYGLGIAVIDDLLYAVGGGYPSMEDIVINERYTPIEYGTLQPPPDGSSTPEPQPEPFPIAMFVGSAAAAAVIGLGLLVYLKKRKPHTAMSAAIQA
ncbi:TPA: hypothetical protein HA274_06680 [Candidatus Bathyarchaeota archaeon]|nr:hypothetical protein [Candidatus Bathyarchaeota archaeon]